MNVAAAERAEMNAAASSTMLAPAAIARQLGLHLVFDEGALMTLATTADVLALNRIVGLGIETPATRQQLDRMIEVARLRGTKRLFIQLAPSHQSDDLAAWVESAGGTKHNRWVRLWRDVLNVPAVKTDLEVRQLTTSDAIRSGEIVAEAFGMPIEIAPWIGSTIGQAGWAHFGAFDNDKLVASAAIYLSGNIGWLGFAATDSNYRGYGAQGALIGRRIQYAGDHGCESVVVETAEQTPEHSAPSYRNMLRFGFTESYFRQNYVVTL